jgi:rod shape-determining protein MreD
VTARIGMMAAVLVTALLLQTVVFPTFAIAGWRPDLVVLTVVAFALADGPGTGLRYGFAAGLVADMLSGSGQLVGLSALVYLLVGYGAGISRPYLSGTGLLGRAAVAGGGSCLAIVLLGLFTLLLEVAPLTAAEIIEGAAIVGLYNAALAPVALTAVWRLARRLPSAAGSGSIAVR